MQKRDIPNNTASFLLVPKTFLVYLCLEGMDQVLGASMVSSKEAIQKVQRVVLHPAFDLFFAVVVFANAIFIGVEAQSNMSGNWLSPSTIRVANYSFAIAFTLELLGRIVAGGCSFFYSEDCIWNYLDVCIVITSIIEVVFNLVSEAQGSGQNIAGLKVFRIIRLSKVVKTVRLVRILRFVLALRTLVTSIAHTLKALFWALTLLALIIYLFAILFAQAVHDASLDPDKTAAAIGEKYFRSLPEIMLTLFMSIAGGVSWEDVIYPLIEIDALWAFFFLFFAPRLAKGRLHGQTDKPSQMVLGQLARVAEVRPFSSTRRWRK